MFEKEHRNYCSVHILGRMMFGESYRLGGDFDLRLIGYFFAVPKTMLKAVSAEPFFLRCCGSFRKVNWSSNQPVPFEGRVTMNLSPVLIRNYNKQFVVTTANTDRIFIICARRRV